MSDKAKKGSVGRCCQSFRVTFRCQNTNIKKMDSKSGDAQEIETNARQ